MKTGIFASLLTVFVFFTACSSAPKRPAETFSVRKMAETQLELANKAADRAQYENALTLLTEARRLAVSADNPSLRIRTSLSRGNILFYLGNRAEAEEQWALSLKEAEDAKDSMLAAASKLYTYRAALLAGEAVPSDTIRAVNAELPALKNDSLFTALANTVIGLAQKAQNNKSEAEKALIAALQIHQKENYLELAAYDWYVIASIRSASGDYQSALDALQNAIAFDRRAENTHGLGMDYLAQGDVYAKMNDPERAKFSYARAQEIFVSANMLKEAERAQSRSLL